MDMNLSKLWKTVKDREAWRAAAHGVTKNQTQPSNWTTPFSRKVILCALTIDEYSSHFHHPYECRASLLVFWQSRAKGSMGDKMGPEDGARIPKRTACLAETTPQLADAFWGENPVSVSWILSSQPSFWYACWNLYKRPEKLLEGLGTKLTSPQRSKPMSCTKSGVC